MGKGLYSLSMRMESVKFVSAVTIVLFAGCKTTYKEQTLSKLNILVEPLLKSPFVEAKDPLLNWRELEKLGDASAPGLERILESGPRLSRMIAATLLGNKCASKSSLRLLLRTAKDSDPEVAASACLALGDLGDKRAIPSLEKLVEPSASSFDPLVRTAAASALLRLGYTDAVPFLVSILEAGIPGDRGPEKKYGLPIKQRWALEKEIAVSALRNYSGKSFGFEPELGYRDQAEKARAWRKWWEARKSKL